MGNKTKEHNVLKFFMPLLACVYGLLLSFGCASVMTREFHPGRELLSKGLEIIAIALTVYIIKKPLSALFPQVKEYPLMLPRPRSALFVALLIPLWFMIKQGMIYWVSGGAGAVELELLVYTRQELLQDLIPCISAVFLAPVYEELCFRHLAIAPFRKKISQLIMGTLVAAFFGFIHARNMLGSFLDGFVFMLLFVLSRNISLSILAHALMNLWAMILGVLVHFGILQVHCGDFPVVWLIENRAMYVIAILLALAGTAVYLAGRRRGKMI